MRLGEIATRHKRLPSRGRFSSESRFWDAHPRRQANPVQLRVAVAGLVAIVFISVFGHVNKLCLSQVGSALNDGLFHARCRKLTDRSRELIYDRVHDLPGLEREDGLSCVIAVLRAHHDDLGTINLLATPPRQASEAG